tara:strand:- start:41 stop:313 length:273 start_codon:yes stop_codon:yes gene_type:complete
MPGYFKKTNHNYQHHYNTKQRSSSHDENNDRFVFNHFGGKSIFNKTNRHKKRLYRKKTKKQNKKYKKYSKHKKSLKSKKSNRKLKTISYK